MWAINTSVEMSLYNNITGINKRCFNESNFKSESSMANVCGNLTGFIAYTSTLDYQIGMCACI